MRSTLLPLALLLLGAPASAQLTAGEVPTGMSALELNIAITLGNSFTENSAGLEVDCDDMLDGWAWLLSGAPPVDAPNIARLHVVDTDIEVCADLAPGAQQRPKYHAFGEPLDCGGGFAWQTVDELVLGDFGGFTATGPVSITDRYVAYRRGAAVGWMLLSFNLNNGPEVSLQIPELLPLCPSTTGMGTHHLTPEMLLFPNPGNGEALRVESTEALRGIELLDPSGRIIAMYPGTVRTIPAPAVAGTYHVRFLHADGRRSSTRLVRF